MNNFTVDILTPSKVIVKDLPAESVVVPSVKGVTGILPNHTHIMTSLEAGVVTVYGGPDDADDFYFVSHGVCKVLETKITVLAETAEKLSEIDFERAKAALSNAESKLMGSLSDEDLVKFRRKVERAKLRIQMKGYKH